LLRRVSVTTSAAKRSRRFLLAGLCLAGGHPCVLGAQESASGTGTVAGVISDSIHAGALVGALVSIRPVDLAIDTTFTAVTNSDGRFAIEGVIPGRYTIAFASPLLDSLEYGGAVRNLSVAAGGTTRADLAVPSRATLRSLACPGMPVDSGAGALVGLVSDADRGAPLSGAQVLLSGNGRGADLVTDGAGAQPWLLSTTADSLGQYRICRAPTDTKVVVQVQYAERLSEPHEIVIPDVVGIRVLNVSLGSAEAHTVAGSRLPASGSTAAATGSASLTGVVRGQAGQWVVGAHVRVVGTRATTRTDDRGNYVLAGLPAGRQALEIRQLGYALYYGMIELRADRTDRADVQLERAVTLDSLIISARQSKYPDFDRRRAEAIEGKFFTEDDIQRTHPLQLSEFFARVGIFRIVGQGPDARMVSNRDPGCRNPVMYFDRLPVDRINDVPPSLIGAIEVYPGLVSAPMQYRSACGTVMLWSKR
jgi:hypothetical protein